MKRAWLNFICIFLCVLIPFISIVAGTLLIPSQFDKTFLGALSPKVERLYSIEEPKIIVVGGSSVPFGVDTKLLEEALGMPSVNFGLYASLGTKIMLDMSRGAIGEGDIVVIAPETDAQTYSLYFNAESAWQACDSDISLLSKIDSDNYSSMIGGFWKYASQKVKYFFAGEHLDPSGVYNAASFDEYGDIVYERAYNTMELGYDPSLSIEFSADIISDDFIGYVNEYVAYAKSKGAKVYFSFAPMNLDSVKLDSTLDEFEAFDKLEADIIAFTDFIKENFDAEVISDPADYLYDSGYFYDSNFHLNDAGSVMHTANLAADLAAAEGKDLLIDIAIPDAPEKPIIEDDTKDYSYDENEKYFIFEEVVRSGEVVGYNIVGLSDLGKHQTYVTTPRAYNEKKIYSIEAGAFASDNITEIYITDYIPAIGDGAFAGAPKLKKVHILATNPDDTSVNNVSMGLCNGMAADAKFYVSPESYNDFISNYFWGPYANMGKIVKE